MPVGLRNDSLTIVRDAPKPRAMLAREAVLLDSQVVVSGSHQPHGGGGGGAAGGCSSRSSVVPCRSASQISVASSRVKSPTIQRSKSSPQGVAVIPATLRVATASKIGSASSDMIYPRGEATASRCRASTPTLPAGSCAPSPVIARSTASIAPS